MPTIKDIAKHAKVSHGTVSNVLNNRGNVSVEKINLVKKSIEELGYKVNLQAKNLRQGKTNQVAIIIPRLDIKRYVDVYIAINTILSKKGYDVTIHCSNDSIEEEKILLNSISASNPTAIVIVSVSSNITYIENEDVTIFFALKNVKNRPANSCYVGFDYYKIGEDLAKKAIDEGASNVACFCGMPTNISDKLFYKGCFETLEKNGVKCKDFFSETAIIHQKAFKIAMKYNKYDSIITLGEERALNLCDALNIVNDEYSQKIYCASSKTYVNKSCFDKYVLNYKYCASIIANKIIEKDNKDEIIDCDGFENSFSDIKVTDLKKQINFLASQSPTSEALTYLVPKFTKKTGIKVKIIKYPYQELYNKVKNSYNTKAYDIIRMDMAWLSKLGHKIYSPLDLSSYPYKNIKENLVDSIPNNYFYSKDKIYALPFDTSAQLLYYRRDLFEDSLIKRDFFEKTKKQLNVPTTYEEFDYIAKYFTKSYNQNSPTKFGTSMIKGSSVAIACEVLPRIKAKGISIFDSNGKVKINTKQVKDTILEFFELSKYTSEGQYSWWQNSIEEFANEEIAMTIVFGNHASRLVESQKSELINKIGFATIPGGRPMLGGGVIGISKNTKKQKEIDTFLRWVYSKEITDHVNYLGGYISSKNINSNLDAINLYPWITGIENSFECGWRYSKKVKGEFDEFEFEQIFGTTLSAIVSGLLDIDEGLSEAQRAIDIQFNQL